MTTDRIRSMDDRQQRVDYVFAGGGTGGHLFPGIAVAEELRRIDRHIAVEFWGTERDLERQILADRGWPHRSMSGEPSTDLRRHPLRVLRGNFMAYRQAQAWLAACRPAAVVGLGGFSSAPVVYAARRLNIPIVLLEQNVIPGRATRYLSRWADAVCTAFPQTASHLRKTCRIELTGNPLTQDIIEMPALVDAATRRGLLILGGSQGASAINDAMLAALPRFKPHRDGWHVIHQTGRADADRVRAAYERHQTAATVEAFFSPLSAAYARSGCVVSRAGATTLAEISCCGIPAILIPYPHAVNQHQRLNAEFYRDRGAAIVVLQDNNVSDFARELADQIVSLLTNDRRLEDMSRAMRGVARPDAAARVVEVIRRVSSAAR